MLYSYEFCTSTFVDIVIGTQFDMYSLLDILMSSLSKIYIL